MLANHDLPHQLKQKDKITMDKGPFAENCPHVNIFHTSGCFSFLFCSFCFSRPSSTGNSVSSSVTLKLFPTDRIEINETCKYVTG